jgi:hypothetical protein
MKQVLRHHCTLLVAGAYVHQTFIELLFIHHTRARIHICLLCCCYQLKLQRVDVPLLCFLLPPLQGHIFSAGDINTARQSIFHDMRRQSERHQKVIYFDGWRGFGAVPVLRSIVKELGSIKSKNTPPELCFDRIIYIDCSVWEI